MTTTESTPPTDDIVLRVDNLTLEYTIRGSGSRSLRAVDSVSLALRKGETLGLVGESGCGKSSLVRTIFDINTPTSGTVEIFGKRLADLNARERRRVRNRVQMVFQDPYSALDPRMTAHEIVAEPLRIVRRYSKARVIELLEAVGLSAEVMSRRPGAFSGGQRQRLGIARALALEPDVLVLDEPVSALDVSVQAQVINVLKGLQRRLGLAYLFIAHDLSVVSHISDRVAVMHLGQIVETGTTEEIFSRPVHPYTRALLSAAPVPDPRARSSRRRVVLSGELPDATQRPSGCSFRTRCPIAQDACAHNEPALASPDDGSHLHACHFPDDSQRLVAPAL